MKILLTGSGMLIFKVVGSPWSFRPLVCAPEGPGGQRAPQPEAPRKLMGAAVKTAGEASALLEHDHACNPCRLAGCQ